MTVDVVVKPDNSVTERQKTTTSAQVVQVSVLPSMGLPCSNNSPMKDPVTHTCVYHARVLECFILVQ
jgi:hypothetical protein